MEIGIIGSGEMGICLASKFIQQGHAVTIANSRDAESLKELTERLGANAASVKDIIRNKQVIVIAIPTKNVPDLKPVFKGIPKSVIVIDTMNYYPNLRDGAIPAINEAGIDSLWVEEQLGCPVIKAFNSILATSLTDLGRPKDDKSRITITISGADRGAKGTVARLIDGSGFDAIDIGTIAQSWKQQPGSSIYCRDLSFQAVKEKIDAMGANWRDVRAAADVRRKADEALMKTDYSAYLKGLKD